MNKYIDTKIFGLPKPLRKGSNTSKTSKRIGKEYVHKWTDGKSVLWRCLIKRQNKYGAKYFKTMKEAKTFVLMLRENRYF
jgi:predicted transcriptional regulator with HTH domain